MRVEAVQKRSTLIISLLVIVALIAAVWFSGIAAYLGKNFSSGQPYSSPHTEINAQVNTDGAMLVTEQRTFECTSKVTSIRWKYDAPSTSSKISMRGVRVTTLDESGNAVGSEELAQIPFQESWRSSEDGNNLSSDAPGYAIDEKEGAVYTFFPAENATVVYTFDYTVTGGIQVYHDIAELNWTFLSSAWQTDTDDLVLTVNLPVPSGSPVVAGHNVHAWTHGPQNGSVGISDAGIVTYQSPHVEKGQWASLHLTFPPGWLSNLPDTTTAREHINDYHLSTVLSEEADWVDQSAAGQARGNQFDIALIVICLILLALSVLAYATHGRERRPRTRDGAPDEDATIPHPAIASLVLNWQREGDDDVTASIMRLERIGAIEVEDLERQAGSNYPEIAGPPGMKAESDAAVAHVAGKASGGDTGTVSTSAGNACADARDYRFRRLTRNRDLADPMDRATMDLLFSFSKAEEHAPEDARMHVSTTVNIKPADNAPEKTNGEKQGDAVALSDIHTAREQDSDTFVAALATWRGRQKRALAEGAYFDQGSFKWQLLLLGIAALLVVTGIAMKVASGSNTLLGVGLPTAMVMALTANYLPRRTQKGQDLVAALTDYGDKLAKDPDAVLANPDEGAAREYLRILQPRSDRRTVADPAWAEAAHEAFARLGVKAAEDAHGTSPSSGAFGRNRKTRKTRHP